MAMVREVEVGRGDVVDDDERKACNKPEWP
jgi:hypothetical protein